MSAALNAVLIQRVEVAPGLGIFRVAPEGGELSDFAPGQYTVLGLPGHAPRCEFSDPETPPVNSEKIIKRAYSVASSSVAKEYLEFYIALVPSGALTPRLFALKTGNGLWLGPKFTGMFTLDQVPNNRHVVLVATGTGLAPYMSMLRTQLIAGGARRFAVLHGARHSADLGYRSELVTLQRLCDNFAYLPCIDFPEEEAVPWYGQIGRVQDLWSRGLIGDAWDFTPHPDTTHVFLCGNPGMIECMLDLLSEEGFKEHKKRDPGQIHLEKYW